jgi:hypothetical protein
MTDKIAYWVIHKLTGIYCVPDNVAQKKDIIIELLMNIILLL